MVSIIEEPDRRDVPGVGSETRFVHIGPDGHPCRIQHVLQRLVAVMSKAQSMVCVDNDDRTLRAWIRLAEA